MLNTNNTMQTQTSNALDNAIMKAGGKDRPPMLAPGNYNPPYKFKWTEKIVPVAEGSSETTAEGYMENYKNVLQDIRDQLNVEAKVVQIILIGIDNDIYSTVDACLNACEMWKAIEWLKQGECTVTSVVQKSGIQCYNWQEYGHVSRECQKLKRANDATYHKEKMLLCKQEEAGVQLNAEQADWKDDTDDEPDDQELEAHYMYMAHIQEVTPDAADNSGPIFDTEPLQKVQNSDDNYNVFANDKEHPE
ncbi:hypothetical protein Tco_0307142 [Tanacetum coccineum]